MRCERISLGHLICLFFFLHSLTLCSNAEEFENEYSKGCARLRCANGTRCIKRRFWCKTPPCPGMMYCYASRREMLKGPLTCDTVRCSKGHLCIIRVRGCDWDGKCKHQIARCIPEKEYHEGATSCHGFKCPSRERCILKETSCVNPPCKLVRTCADAKDVENWLDECRSLNCVSRHECFLRTPENNCSDPWCIHTPACTVTTGDELISKHCHGWICPRGQKCAVRIVNSCKGFDCAIERSCRASSSTAGHSTLANNEVDERPSTLKTSMRIANERNDEEMDRRAMKTEPSSLPTPRPWSLNCNESSPTDVTIFDEFSSTSPPATFLADSDVESSTLRDTKRLEVLKKIYIATDDDALPLSMVLEGINFVGQSYPVWNEPYQLEVRDEDDGNWRYSVQKPYRILLPPYEPVILVEDVRRRGQFFPFLAYPFDHAFDEVTFVPMPKVTEDTGSSETSDFPMTTNDGNYINFFTTVEMKNSKTSHDDDSSSSDYATSPLDIRDKEMNNYFYDDDEGQPPYMIHDYTERNEPTTLVVHEFKSNTVESATDNLYEERYDFANYPHETISVHVDQSGREEASSGEMSYGSSNRDAIPYFEELEVTSTIYDSAFHRAASNERNSDRVYDDYHENFDISAATSE